VNSHETLFKAIGIKNGAPTPPSCPDDSEAKLRAFLTYHNGNAKIDNVPGSMKIEPAGSMWKITLSSDNMWIKKTFYTADLSTLAADVETALSDGTLPFEVYKSKRQRKNPDKPDGEKA